MAVLIADARVSLSGCSDSLALVALDTLGRESPLSNIVHTGAAPTATPPTAAYGSTQSYGGLPPCGGSGAPPTGYGPSNAYGTGAPLPPAGTTAPPSVYAPSGTAGAPIPPTQPSPYNAPIPPAQPSPYNAPGVAGPQTAPRPLR